MHCCEHVGTKHVRFTPKHYPGDPTGTANRGPAEAQQSGFGGERRSSGATELLPLKAKRRMWSLRRRGVSFSPIFLQTKKDGVPEGRWSSIAVSKNGPQKGKPMHPCAPLRPFFMLPSYHVFLPLSSIIFPFCRNFQEKLPQNRPRTA